MSDLPPVEATGNVEVVTAYIEVVTDAMMLAYKALAGILEYGTDITGADFYMTDLEIERFQYYLKEHAHAYR